MIFKNYTGAKCKCGEPSTTRLTVNHDENKPTDYDRHFCDKCFARWERERDWEYDYERREDKITCPYCGAQWIDSWEIQEDDDNMLCDECGKRFSLVIEHEITYSTTRRIEDMPDDWDGE